MDYSVGGITWDLIKSLCSGLYKGLVKIGKKNKCEIGFNNFMESISDMQVNINEDIFLQLTNEYQKNTGMNFDKSIKDEMVKCIKENNRELRRFKVNDIAIKVNNAVGYNNSTINIIGIQNNM